MFYVIRVRLKCGEVLENRKPLPEKKAKKWLFCMLKKYLDCKDIEQIFVIEQGGTSNE